MRQSRFTEAQIIGMIKEQEAGMLLLRNSFSGYLRSYLGTQTRYTHGTHFEITFVLTTVIKQ